MPTKQNTHKKMKYKYIKDNIWRKATFFKRKKRVMKKLTELITLCDVKACAVIIDPYKPGPVAWPSREGVEEVVSEFVELSMEDWTKKMVKQEAFLREMVVKKNAQMEKLRAENRKFEIRDTMLGCHKGEIDVHNLTAKDVQDLNSFIDKYLNEPTSSRFKNLKKNGESSSSSLPPLVFADGVVAPVGIPNQNQGRMIQLQTDSLFEFYGQIPQKIQDFNKNVNLNPKKKMVLDLNQIPPAEEDEDIPSMDESHHQP